MRRSLSALQLAAVLSAPAVAQPAAEASVGIAPGARDSTGQRLFDVSGQATEVWGMPVQYPMPGLWPTGASVAPSSSAIDP